MKQAIERGLTTEGVLPGGLDVQRKAKILYNQRHIDESPETRESRLVCSCAFLGGACPFASSPRKTRKGG